MSWSAFSDLVWAVLALAWGATELLARRARASQLTFANVLRAITVHRVGRVVLALSWMWLGWHVFAR